MQLDSDDERILAGEEGETRQRMLELLVALGKVFGAEQLVPIRSAQVSGASYKTIGEYGLQWLNTLDAKAVVPAVLNPIGMPRGRWEEMGIDPDFAQKQRAVVAAYERLGIGLECTLLSEGDLLWRPPRMVGVISGQLCELGHWSQDQP
jgi:predicted aconitase